MSSMAGREDLGNVVIKLDLFTSPFNHVAGVINERTDMLSSTLLYFIDFSQAMASISTWNKMAAGTAWCRRGRRTQT